MARRRRKRVLPRIRFKKKFPFISFGGAGRSCRARLKSVEYHLARAMEQVPTSRPLFDNPRVKSLMRKRDVLLTQCTHIAVKRKGKWEYRFKS